MKRMNIILFGIILLLFTSFKYNSGPSKLEIERMYQTALDIDSLSPYLKKVFSEPSKYCWDDCSFIEDNENIDSTYILSFRGKKLIFWTDNDDLFKSKFLIVIENVKFFDNIHFSFTIHYSSSCAPQQKEICTQVYQEVHFVKYNNEWRLLSSSLYEKIRYHKLTFYDKELQRNYSDSIRLSKIDN